MRKIGRALPGKAFACPPGPTIRDVSTEHPATQADRTSHRLQKSEQRHCRAPAHDVNTRHRAVDEHAHTSLLRPVTATLAPLAASNACRTSQGVTKTGGIASINEDRHTAVALPIPDDEPVTSADLPLNIVVLLSVLLSCLLSRTQTNGQTREEARNS